MKYQESLADVYKACIKHSFCISKEDVLNIVEEKLSTCLSLQSNVVMIALD